MQKTAAQTHRYTVGDTDVLVVSDGERTFPLQEGFVLNADLDECNNALAEAGMPPNRMTIVFNPVLLVIGAERVLIDAGNGSARNAQDPSRKTGLLVGNLQTEGIDPTEITKVVISHFHRDHIDGLLNMEGRSAFPNAEILVPAREWNFWMDEGEMSRAAPGRIQELFKNSRRVFAPIKAQLRTFEWDTEVAPGLRAFGTPGHSVGHTSFILSSASESVFIQSDVTNHPALFVSHPGWHAAFDQDPVGAEATRRKIYDMLTADQLPVQGYHHPFPALSLVEKDGPGYRLTSLTELG